MIKFSISLFPPLPKSSVNPLILGGSDLEKYFLYNLEDKKKSNMFLNKVDNIVRRKETGSYILSDDEIRKLEYLKLP